MERIELRFAAECLPRQREQFLRTRRILLRLRRARRQCQHHAGPTQN